MNVIQNPFQPRSKSFKNTFCVFNEMDIKEIENLMLSYKSESGSSYFYTEMGMFRLSNHWGKLANSKWRLIAMKPETTTKTKLGFANWSDFYPDNNQDLLYYLEADFENNAINYQHKNNPIYDKKAILRTALATTKRIKQARNILLLTNWAKHFEYQNLNELRFKIINELIFSNKTLEEIKKNIYNE